MIIKGGQSPTHLQLWNNGLVVGGRDFVESKWEGNLTFQWLVQSQPATLTLLATEKDGQTVVSNAVTIFPAQPETGYSVHTALPGDSRQALSVQYGIPIENITTLTIPEYGDGEEITVNTPVFLKLPESSARDTPVTFIPDGFTAPENEKAPTKSLEINGNISGNQAEIQISANSDEIKNLVLFRSEKNTGIFKPIFDQQVVTPEKIYIVKDQIDDTEIVSYFIMGYNAEISFPGNFYQPEKEISAHPPKIAGALPTNDGRLHIMDGVGIVYFYASINQNQAERVPEIGFIPVINGFVDLNDALVSITDEAQFPVSADLEVWTWTGTTAQLIGNVHTLLEKTTLAVCVDGNMRCGGIGSGEFNSRELVEAKANTDIQGGTDFDFPWKTSLANNPQALVQVSLKPFSDQSTSSPDGLIYETTITGQCTVDGCGSVFNLDFSVMLEKPGQGIAVIQNHLQYPDETTLSIPVLTTGKTTIGDVRRFMLSSTVNNLYKLSEATSNFHQYGNLILYPIHFYVRVVPTYGGEITGSPSNTVHVEYGPFGAASTIEYIPTVSPPPQPEQIYTAKIIEFTPPIPPSLGWGCVYITDVASGTFNESYFKSLMSNHQPYCPATYQGEGEDSWYESLWNFATGAVNWLSEKYEELKSVAVSQIAGVLDSAGICSNCEAYVSAALSAGMVALGIPPELPDFSKLTDAGIDYLVTEVSQSMGVPCDSYCMDAIRSGVHKLAEDMKAQTVTSYMDETEAHNHGRKPLFIPPGLIVEPAKESSWQMANLHVQVSRKPGTESISAEELAKIESALYINFDGYNDRTGDSYTVYNCWSGGCDLINPSPDCQAVAVPGCPETRQVTAPLEGQLFNPYIIMLGDDQIPHLQPGQVKDLHLALIPSVFWIPGHETETTYNWFDDWGYLFEGGTGKVALDMTAMTCLKNISGYAPSCSYTLERTDFWEVSLPDTSTWGYNQIWTTK